MEKLIYLLSRPRDLSALRRQLLEQTVTALRAAGARDITVNIADLDEIVADRAPGRIVGPWPSLGASLAFWLDCVDERDACETALAQTGCELTGFLVTESVPQPCERDWPEGEPRPGVTQFTAHGKPDDVSEAEFFDNWCEHTTLSFDLHPRRWSYVRNAVARPLTENAAPYRAIVLEHFRELEDFTDESRYFGDPAVVEKMFAELPGFCDIATMVTGPMSEYHYS